MAMSHFSPKKQNGYQKHAELADFNYFYSGEAIIVTQ
jgi:hypothetical protein